MVTASHSASEVFDHLRSLFRGTSEGLECIDVNQIVRRALNALRGELEDHGVTVLTELTSELPLVMGHSGQLQEVILNLAHNAIDAMDASIDGSRVLRVVTRLRITIAMQLSWLSKTLDRESTRKN
jgi:C4-dicarboxylate-specific signal transduction histidine kinase